MSDVSQLVWGWGFFFLPSVGSVSILHRITKPEHDTSANPGRPLRFDRWCVCTYAHKNTHTRSWPAAKVKVIMSRWLKTSNDEKNHNAERRRRRGIEWYHNFGCLALRDMTGVRSVFFSTYKGFSPPSLWLDLRPMRVTLLSSTVPGVRRSSRPVNATERISGASLNRAYASPQSSWTAANLAQSAWAVSGQKITR